MLKVSYTGTDAQLKERMIAARRISVFVSLLCLIAVKPTRGASGPQQAILSTVVSKTSKTGIYVTNSGSNSVNVFSLGSSGNVAPIANIGDPVSLKSPSGIAIDTTGTIYVTDVTTNNIRIYAAGASSADAPIATIAGAKTQLSGPSSIAVDSAGKIYVLNSATGSLTVYAALGSRTGNLNKAPIAIISGANTGISNPYGITLDSKGDIYVTNFAEPSNTGSILVFAPLGSSRGTLNETPLATISGSNTGLTNPGINTPEGIALDAGGNIYVLSGFGIVIYPPLGNATGTLNEAPLETITGTSVFVQPIGIALDSSGNIYVANYGAQNTLFPGSIAVISAASVTAGGGDVTPVLVITSENGGLHAPLGIALDAKKNIYITNGGGNANGVLVFPPLGNGTGVVDEPPTSTLGIPLTGLSTPLGIALDSSANIYIANQAGGVLTIGSITKYSAGSTGNITPTATIAYTVTGFPVAELSGPDGIALDGAGNIYTTNDRNYLIPGNNIQIYPSLGSSAGTLNEPPTVTIGGSGTNQTELSGPAGIGLDAAGRIYVTNSSGSVTIYAPLGSSTGTLNELPIASISGADTGLTNPEGITLDSEGNIYVANFGEYEYETGTYGPSSITVYPSTAVTSGGGDVKPIATISGSKTQLNGSYGIALDANANLYITNFGQYSQSGFMMPSITVYSAKAVSTGGGNVTPMTTINGSKTMLNEPAGIIIGPFAP